MDGDGRDVRLWTDLMLLSCTSENGSGGKLGYMCSVRVKRGEHKNEEESLKYNHKARVTGVWERHCAICDTPAEPES